MLNANRIKDHFEQVVQDEELKVDYSNGAGLFGSKSGASNLSFSDSNNPQFLKDEEDHIKPADLFSNTALRIRIEELISKHLHPEDERPIQLNDRRINANYEKIYEEVQKLQGPILLKEYSQTVESFSILKTRETFITLIQNGDLDKILP